MSMLRSFFRMKTYILWCSPSTKRESTLIFYPNLLQWEKELRITFKTFVLKYTTRLPQIYTTINSHRAIMVKRFCAFVCLAFNYYTFYALSNFLANRYIETIRERFCVCKNMLIKYNMNRNPVTNIIINR